MPATRERGQKKASTRKKATNKKISELKSKQFGLSWSGYRSSLDDEKTKKMRAKPEAVKARADLKKNKSKVKALKNKSKSTGGRST